MDTVAERLLEKRPGAKETALWSAPAGGALQQRDEHRTDSNRLALTDEQAVEIAWMAQRVETLTAVPADVEWGV